MANLPTANAKTFANASADNSKLIGEVFSETVMRLSATKDVFSMFEGPEGSGKPFLVKTDLAKVNGQTLNIPVMGGAGKMPRRGEQKLLGKEEKVRLGSFDVKLDIVRHAFARNEKFRQFVASAGSIEAAIAPLTAEHFGRFKETDMKMALIKGATDTNTVLPNNRASIDALLSNDTISPTVIDEARSTAAGLGARAVNIRKNAVGAEILRYLLLGTEKGFQPLTSNSTYNQAVQNAGVRGDENTIFAGGYVDWNNVGIFHQQVVAGDHDGPTGDPLEQREYLGEAITAGTAAVTIQGGGLAGPSDDAMYFRWFEGFDYLFTEDQAAATPDSNTYYLLIYNVTGADRGKFGIYSYTGSNNDGQTIDTAQRLRAAAAGTAVTTLAGQAWSGSVHTDAHPQGSIIVQINAKCVPYTRMFLMGQACAVRGYGSLGSRGPNSFKAIMNKEDYDFTTGTGYMGCFGQDVCEDTQGQPRGYVEIVAAYTPLGVKNLPVVLS